MARRKLREKKSKFGGTKNVLQDMNVPAHSVLHQLEPTVPSLPVGGFTGQFLVKLSDNDYDVGWGYADAGGILDGGVSGAVHTPPATDGGTSTAVHSDTVDGGSATT